MECDALEELGNKGWNWESLSYYMRKVSYMQLTLCLPCLGWSFQSETTIPTDLPVAQARLYAAVRDPDPKQNGLEGASFFKFQRTGLVLTWSFRAYR